MGQNLLYNLILIFYKLDYNCWDEVDLGPDEDTNDGGRILSTKFITLSGKK
jgi:hypothetical protein